MLIYYVYAYLNKTTNLPYYIGKGKGNRATDKHRNVTTPKDKSKIVFLECNLTEIGAFAIERRYIRWYGRKDLGTGILSNRTDGGEGGSGLLRSEQTREKISQANTGRKHSEKTKQKISSIVIKKLSSTSEEILKERDEKRRKSFGKRIWIFMNGKTKRVKNEELQNYLSGGWILGQGPSPQKGRKRTPEQCERISSGTKIGMANLIHKTDP